MEHTVNKGLTELMQRFASDMDKNQESTTYEEADEAMWLALREALGELERLEGQLMSHYAPGPPAPEGMTRSEQLVWLRKRQMRQLW